MILFFTLLTKKSKTVFNSNSVYFHSGSHARTSKNHVLVRNTKFYSFQNSSCYDDKKTKGKKAKNFCFCCDVKVRHDPIFVVIHSIFISVFTQCNGQTFVIQLSVSGLGAVAGDFFEHVMLCAAIETESLHVFVAFVVP